MADPAHLRLVRGPRDQLEQFINQNPQTPLDLTNAQIDDVDLSKLTLFQWKFSGSRLHRAKFDGSKLDRCEFAGSMLVGASFVDSKPNECTFIHSRMNSVNFSYANLYRANLSDCDLDDAVFRSTNLSRANLDGSRLKAADLMGANLFECSLADTQMRRVSGLGTLKRTGTLHSRNHPKYVDEANIPFIDRVTSWETIRIFGRLPLFTASYATLIIQPIVMFLIKFYDTQIADLKNNLGSVPPSFLEIAIGRLHQIGIPTHSVTLLFGAICLAIASTLYAICAPQIIKEFSKEQWVYQMDRPLIQYMNESLTKNYLRYVCFLFYVSGSALSAWVISTKLWGMALYII